MIYFSGNAGTEAPTPPNIHFRVRLLFSDGFPGRRNGFYPVPPAAFPPPRGPEPLPETIPAYTLDTGFPPFMACPAAFYRDRDFFVPAVLKRRALPFPINAKYQRRFSAGRPGRLPPPSSLPSGLFNGRSIYTTTNAKTLSSAFYRFSAFFLKKTKKQNGFPARGTAPYAGPAFYIARVLSNYPKQKKKSSGPCQRVKPQLKRHLFPFNRNVTSDNFGHRLVCLLFG